VIPAIEKGFFQSEIHQAAYRYQQEVDRKERIVVGVNDFVEEQEHVEIPLLRIDPEGERRHLERLVRIRCERDAVATTSALERLERAARGADNLMPYFMDAVKAYATLGEICGVLRRTFGEFREQWAA
jgi:methylmalonyl-CoA mutase N-terminal domain/subunit